MMQIPVLTYHSNNVDGNEYLIMIMLPLSWIYSLYQSWGTKLFPRMNL